MEAPHHSLQDLKDLLLLSWCQIPQHIFKDHVESMPQKLRAVLLEQEDLHDIRLEALML